MIARIWRGRTAANQADSYQAYLHETGLKDYAAVPGNRGVLVLRRTEGDATEFVLISLWDSLESIEAFAGPALDTAVYYPEDDVYLLEREPQVLHYDIHLSPGGTLP
jgi:heme-degrading monooxygenase HmoA